MRIKGHKCFDYIHRVGNRYHGPSMLIRVVKSKPNLIKAIKRKENPYSVRFAIAISNKVNKKAVIRNYLRRRIHEHLAMKFSESKGLGKWVLISLKPFAGKQENTQLLEECDNLLRQAGLFL